MSQSDPTAGQKVEAEGFWTTFADHADKLVQEHFAFARGRSTPGLGEILARRSAFDARKRTCRWSEIAELVITPHPEDADDVLIDPVTTRKTPARKVEPIRARRTSRNQLQFDFLEDEG